MSAHLSVGRFRIHLWRDKEFEETQHPRAKGGAHGGEFVKKGSATEGFLPAAKAEKGHTSSSGKELPAHIKSLKIPPAWTDVRYSNDPKSPLQVVGLDAKGRVQRIYSEKFSDSQSAAKFARIKKLEKVFGRAAEKNQKLLTSRNAATKEAALVLALIMSTGIRPGSERETGAARKAYGATTLLGSHVKVDQSGVRLQFPGKSGKDLDIPVNDKELADLVKQRVKTAGDRQLFPLVTSGGLLRHVKDVTGSDFKTKDFRTLIGTQLAMREVDSIEPPKSATAYKRAVKAVATAVSNKLCNTPTIALQSYISPVVFADWRMSLENQGVKI